MTLSARPPARALTLALLASIAAASCGGSTNAGPPPPAQVLASRRYLLDIPPGNNATVPAALLVALDGAGGSADSVVGDLHLEAFGAAGVVVARPDATVNSAGGSYWNATGDGYAPWDEIFLQAMVDDIKTKLAIDPKRIWILGYSIGGFMAYRMGCVHAETFTAVVGLAGLVSLAPGFCAPSQAVAVLDLHGDHDSTISYDGSPFVGTPPMQTSPSAHDTVALFAARDGCTGALASSGDLLDLDLTIPGAETKRESYAGCPSGVDVALWTLQGSNHTPSLSDSFGPSLLAWLQAHPRP